MIYNFLLIVSENFLLIVSENKGKNILFLIIGFRVQMERDL